MGDVLEFDAGGEGPEQRRRIKTPFGLVVMSGSLAGACIAISVVAGLVIDHLPFAKADEFKTFKTETEQALRQVKIDAQQFRLGQKETLELQLIDREQKLDDRLKAAEPADRDALRQMRAENHQRLEATSAEVRALRAAGVPQ